MRGARGFRALQHLKLRFQKPAPEKEPAGDDDLLARLRLMEEQNRRLMDRLEESEQRHDERMRILLEEMQTLRARVDEGEHEAPVALQEVREAERLPFGSLGEGGGVMLRAPSYMTSGTKGEKKTKVEASFGNGFELLSPDGEYQLQIHQETQVDYRDFTPSGEVFAKDGFVFPRARIFFNGRATKQWDYMFSLNKGFGDLNVLDAWVNWHPSDAIQVKVGRFMTPFNFEQFAIQNMWLISPERSLFTSNLGLNRMLGAQVWGQAFQKQLDYAVGVFDGPRNSYEDFNDPKDVMAFVNGRPFERDEGSFLQFLNVGGSFSYGMQDNPTVPRTWRTASNASNSGTADTYAPPFFSFNEDVRERGTRAFWSGHLAYYYKQLSIVTDYNGGILRYAANRTAAQSVVVPVDGMSVSAGYFLTGEEVQRRTIVEPLKPFDLRRGSFGLGA